MPVRPGRLNVLEHRCIRHRFASGLTAAWEFERGGEAVAGAAARPLVANTAPMEPEAAVRSLGVVHGFEEYLAPALADGRLEPVLEDWSERFPGPFLYHAGRRHLPRPLRAFIDFLKSQSGPAGERAWGLPSNPDESKAS